MHVVKAKFETLIRHVKVFNNGEQPVVEDIGISGGRIVARGQDLDETNADQVIDGAGLWAMPGMFDIHTHYDLELEVAPALSESVRHGTTSVVIANCSLGLAFGAQRKEGFDPIVDCLFEDFKIVESTTSDYGEINHRSVLIQVKIAERVDHILPRVSHHRSASGRFPTINVRMILNRFFVERSQSPTH